MKLEINEYDLKQIGDTLGEIKVMAIKARGNMVGALVKINQLAEVRILQIEECQHYLEEILNQANELTRLLSRGELVSQP